jgi:hypothetical protein
VLIYGGYYRENHENIVKSAKSVARVVQEDEESKDWSESVELIRACPCEWTIKNDERKYGTDNKIEQHHDEIGRHLDNYLYRYPSENDLNFQNGVYVIDAPTDLDKVKKITSMNDIANCIEQGKEKRQQNERIAQQRLARSTVIQKKFGDDILEICISEGDSPIVDTCFLLAKNSKSKVGALFRHDCSLDKTFLSVYCLEESGRKASKIAKRMDRWRRVPFYGWRFPLRFYRSSQRAMEKEKVKISM